LDRKAVFKVVSKYHKKNKMKELQGFPAGVLTAAVPRSSAQLRTAERKLGNAVCSSIYSLFPRKFQIAETFQIAFPFPSTVALNLNRPPSPPSES
jgi:hypothetical protein